MKWTLHAVHFAKHPLLLASYRWQAACQSSTPVDLTGSETCIRCIFNNVLDSSASFLRNVKPDIKRHSTIPTAFMKSEAPGRQRRTNEQLRDPCDV